MPALRREKGKLDGGFCGNLGLGGRGGGGTLLLLRVFVEGACWLEVCAKMIYTR